MTPSPSKGYIALVSVLIISAILMGLVFEVGTGLFLSRESSSEYAAQLEAQANAYSCSEIALLAYARGSVSTLLKTVVTLTSGTCQIDSFIQTSTSVHIETQATEQGVGAHASTTVPLTNGVPAFLLTSTTFY